MLDSSIQAYSEAISLDHSHLEAYVGRGNAYMEYLMEEANVLAKLVTYIIFTSNYKSQ